MPVDIPMPLPFYFLPLLFNKCFIYLSVNLGITLSIIDIIVAYNWVPCHIQGYVNLYLFALGSLTFLLILVGSMYTIDHLRDDSFVVCDLLQNPVVSSLILAISSIVIWGGLILTNTEQGDCDSIFYKYVYYKTMLIFWGPLISIILMTVISGLFYAFMLH